MDNRNTVQETIADMIGSSLTTVVAFRLIGSRERYRKRGLHTQVDEKKD